MSVRIDARLGRMKYAAVAALSALAAVVHAQSSITVFGVIDADQIAVGYVYDLSKRTALYGTYARVNNKGNANFVVDGNPALPSPNPGKDSTGARWESATSSERRLRQEMRRDAAFRRTAPIAMPFDTFVQLSRCDAGTR